MALPPARTLNSLIRVTQAFTCAQAEPLRSWRVAGERLQPWELQLFFGCERCWRYSLLSGLRYSCCLDLLPLLFLFSGSWTVTQAGPPRSCGEAGCPPLQRNRKPFHRVPTLLWSDFIPLASYSSLANYATLLCVTSRTLCLSVVFVRPSSIYLPTQVAGWPVFRQY